VLQCVDTVFYLTPIHVQNKCQNPKKLKKGAKLQASKPKWVTNKYNMIK